MTELSKVFFTSINDGSAKFSAMTGPLENEFIATGNEEEKEEKR